ncbi:MAG: transposase [Caldisericota bacterium]|nr:transposase [Caldisericota bacterium]
MGRAKRIEYKGAIYHVISKTVSSENAFTGEKDYKYFIKLTCDAFLKYQAILLSFALMKNHYHLLLKTENANLSQIMHEINSKYAHYFNSAHIRKGHLFQDRYRSYLITNDEYFINAFVYVNLNPLEAQLVEQLEDYKWCSYRYFKDKNNAPKCLNLEEIHNLSGIEISRITQFIMSKVPESKKYGREINEHDSEENIKKIREISNKIQDKYGNIINNKELKYLLIYALYFKKFKLIDISFALEMPYATIRRIKNKAEKRMSSDTIFTEWLSKICKCF